MIKIIGNISGLGLALIGGIIGASFVTFAHDRMITGKTLQVHGLEIIDAHDNVSAVFTTQESDGSVYLRMHSRTNPGAVILQVIKNNGTLSFYTSNTNNLVAVGYQPDGDVADDRRGIWGITIRGPNHQIRGMNALTLDGLPQRFTFPVIPSQSASH